MHVIYISASCTLDVVPRIYLFQQHSSARAGFTALVVPPHLLELGVAY